MPRRRPKYLPDNYYHIYNRGFDRASIFREEDNYLFVLRKVKHYTKVLNLSIVVYCLMPNHYHFLVRQDGDKSAGLLPQRVFNSYTKAYNLKYNRSGTLFQGPYQVRQITNKSYLLNLCRYIHANPVKDGLVADIEDWPYSNYLEWIGKRSGSLVDLRFVQEHFSSPQRYAEFVLDYLKNRDLPEEIRTYLNSWEELT